MKNKRTILGIAFFLLSVHALLAQKRDQPIVYDYQNDRITQADNKKRPYPLARYLTQPVVEVIGMPDSYDMLVTEVQYDITRQAVAMAPADEDSVALLPGPPVRQIMKKADGDEIEYTIVIKNGDTEIKTVPVFVKVYKRWRIDVSTGVIFNLDLADEKFFYEAASETQSILRKESDETRILPTPAVLTHFYRTSASYFNWGGVFGLGINDNGRTGWYFGGSLLLGRDQRIAISGGLAWRTVKELKGKYEDFYNNGTVINNADKVDTDDLTDELYKRGWFVSFSYNITSKIDKK